MVQYNLKYLRKKQKITTEHFCDVDFLVDRHLEISKFSNAYVDPENGVWNQNRTYCDKSYKHFCSGIENIKRNGLLIKEGDFEMCDEEVLYIGMFMPPWGHFFTDNVKHLWPLLSSYEEHSKYDDIPLVYISEQDSLPENFFCILNLLGIEKNRLRRIERPTMFSSILVPDQCFFYDSSHNYELRCTKEYYDFVDEIVVKIKAENKYEKIFFTTSSFTQRVGNYGVREIDEVFKKLGYAVISPEQLDFIEMVSILRGCKVFASTEGSAGHNSLFLNKGTKCIFLRRVNAVNIYQHIINYVRELDVTLIDAHLSFLLYYRPIPWNGPFFLCCTKQMRKWSGVWRPFPIGTFLKYVMDYGKSWIKAKLS